MSARDTLTVEGRLARVKAVMEAMQSVTAAGDDFQGNAAETCGWLRMMAAEEMAKVKAALGTEVLNRDC